MTFKLSHGYTLAIRNLCWFSMKFKTVGLIGKQAHQGANLSLRALIVYLTKRGCRILVETNTAQALDSNGFEDTDITDIGKPQPNGSGLAFEMPVVVEADATRGWTAEALAARETRLESANAHIAGLEVTV